MRNEINQHRLMTGAKKTRHLTSQKISPALENTLQHPDALDAAFENFHRIDIGTPSEQNSAAPNRSHSASTTKAIIADIAAQLDALDRQRQRLSNLLRDVSI